MFALLLSSHLCLTATHWVGSPVPSTGLHKRTDPICNQTQDPTDLTSPNLEGLRLKAGSSERFWHRIHKINTEQGNIGIAKPEVEYTFPPNKIQRQHTVEIKKNRTHIGSRKLSSYMYSCRRSTYILEYMQATKSVIMARAELDHIKGVSAHPVLRY